MSPWPPICSRLRSYLPSLVLVILRLGRAQLARVGNVRLAGLRGESLKQTSALKSPVVGLGAWQSTVTC